jgi:hypothetical protein
MLLIHIGSLLLLLSLSSCGGSGIGIPSLGDDELKITSHNGYIVTGIPSQWFVIVGEVHNTGGKTLRSIKLEATFSDKEGKDSKSKTGMPLMNVLLPGEKSPFYVSDYANPDMDQYRVKITESSETDEQPNRDFEIVDHTSQINDYGIYQVDGQVKNNGAAEADRTKVFATFFDADGEVVAVAFTTVGTEPWLLAPGETETFKLDAYPDEATEQIVTYTLHVQ